MNGPHRYQVDFAWKYFPSFQYFNDFDSSVFISKKRLPVILMMLNKK